MKENTDKLPLIGMGLKELQDVAFRGGMPRFVGRQLAEWIYSKGATDFGEMVKHLQKEQGMARSKLCDRP